MPIRQGVTSYETQSSQPSTLCHVAVINLRPSRDKSYLTSFFKVIMLTDTLMSSLYHSWKNNKAVTKQCIATDAKGVTVWTALWIRPNRASCELSISSKLGALAKDLWSAFMERATAHLPSVKHDEQLLAKNAQATVPYNSAYGNATPCLLQKVRANHQLYLNHFQTKCVLKLVKQGQWKDIDPCTCLSVDCDHIQSKQGDNTHIENTLP